MNSMQYINMYNLDGTSNFMPCYFLTYWLKPFLFYRIIYINKSQHKFGFL